MRVIQNRIDQAYLDKLDRKIDENFWQEQNKKWLAEKDELSAKLHTYQKPDGSYLEQTHLTIELAKRASGLYKSANVEQKLALLSLLVSNSSLKAGNVDWELKNTIQ
jgi:hypothetical protein